MGYRKVASKKISMETLGGIIFVGLFLAFVFIVFIIIVAAAKKGRQNYRLGKMIDEEYEKRHKKGE